MNPNNRNNSLRNSTPYARHVPSGAHSGRPSHPSRWPVGHIPFKEYHSYSQGSSEHDKEIFGYPKPHGTQSPRHFPAESNAPTEIRQLSPPLHVPLHSQVPDSSVQLRNGPLLSISPNLLAASTIDLDVNRQNSLDFSPRRPAIPTELRHSPIQHSPPFYRNPNPDEGRKSESPSRKRRRIVQSPPPTNNVPHHSSHHHIGPSTRSPWEQRRSQPPRHQPARSPPMRRQRYRDWVPETHPMPRLQHTHTAPPFTHHPATHQPPPHHQPTLVMDVAQMGGFSGCLGSHHHHTQQAVGGGAGGGGGFLGGHHSGGAGAALPALSAAAAAIHYQQIAAATAAPPPPPPHPPDSIELDIIVDHHHHHHHHHHHRSPPHPTLLQVSTPSNIFISEMPRRTSPRRWRSPIPPNTAAFPGWLHFLAMFSNPPLSPYSQDLSSPESQQAENYEELLNLAERLGEAKPRGLNKMEIDQLPSFKFNSETHTGDQTSCVVCMCDFESRQILRGLPCSHQFHAKCVDKWLKSNRTCPICRGDASGYFSSSD